MNRDLRGYLKETRRPVYSAALLLPFLIAYHAGTLVLDTTHINGADALIIRILGLLSVRSMLGSAMVLALCFTVWQLRTRASWKIKSGMLLCTLLESVCFALLLLFCFAWLGARSLLSLGPGSRGIQDLVLYCGAGVYEELVFRWGLLGLLIAIFRRVFAGRKAPVAAAAVLGAVLFSLFHYVGPAGDAFSVGGFLQRMLAGLYFSVLFLFRGFGITAATHAIYDIVLGILIL